MNITTLKFIALILMLLDHVGAVFGLTGWNIISPGLSELFRLVGRVSFPLFAFSVANGWKYTKNKENYFYRIITCSCFSQIPYTLAFYPVNTMYINQNEKSLFSNISVTTILLYIVVTLICIGFYYLYISNNKKILINIAISIMFSIFILKLKFVWFNFNELNIFYTFTIGLLYIYCFEYIKKYRNQSKSKYIFMFIVLILISIFIGLNSDYGDFLLGPILIFLLYITQKYRWLQSILIISWAIALYGVIYGNLKNVIFVIPAAIMILFYNKKSIPNKRYNKLFFYIFYPIHLLLIGLLNIFLKFI